MLVKKPTTNEVLNFQKRIAFNGQVTLTFTKVHMIINEKKYTHIIIIVITNDQLDL